MYTPLYVKTNYSLLSSLITIDELIEFSKAQHLTSIAICDCNMYGAMEFYHKCKQNNIKPLIGLEMFLEKDIVLYFAKDYKGYQNLIKLATIQSERMITIDDLKQYSKGTIKIVVECIELYDKLVALEDLYIGVATLEQYQTIPKDKEIVYLPKSTYFKETDRQFLTYLLMIRDGKTIADNVFVPNSDKPFIINDLEYTKFPNEILYNSNKIADSCNLEFPKAKVRLPKYSQNKGLDDDTYLLELSKKGLKKRLNNEVPVAYQKRLMYELGVIKKMGFSNYFLVVYDFIKYAKQKNILVGPGRGSAAGSLVAYSLGITDIDPMKYDLLFERFLNPERITMPDIDTDFPDCYRDEVIKYVIDRYGEKRVAGIITFGTLGAKQAIRDVSRTLNIPLYKVDAVCKLIPNITKDKLSVLYKNIPSLRAMVESDPQLSKMFKIADRLEGFPRHTSIHAAGIVMCDVDLDEIIPLVKNQDMYLTGYSMEYLEELGLLKMDFLGLKNLTTIMNILNDIKDKEKISVDFQKIPLNDEDAIEIFKTADTTGIFQFESSGMRQFLKKLQPTTFEDIFAAIALFRPGPAVNIDSYIRRKQGKEPISYLDPALKPILDNTYGILIYQEQIMQVANVLAGYSLGEADILRRAMSKKKVSLLKNEEEKFIKQSVALGHDPKTVKQIFQLILNFASYGFNRSHSVAYSLIAYKMAYLKAHFPKYFYSNLLSSVIGSESKTKDYIMEARNRHITIIPPDIKRSTTSFRVVDEGLLFPLSNIKGIGQTVSNEIIKERSKENFQDIYDTISRIYSRNVGSKNLETLILAGTFSSFGYNKKTLINNLSNLINYAELTKDLDPSLVIKPEIEISTEYTKEELLQQEKALFGFYMSAHPITAYQYQYQEALSLNEIDNLSNISQKVTVLILVEKIKIITTKNKEEMAFLTGSDDTTSSTFVLFPSVLKQYPDLQTGQLLKIIGVVERRFNSWQIVVQKIEKLEKRV